MSLIQIVIFCILTLAVPTFIGCLFRRAEGPAGSLPFCWVSGQILLWAGFQLLCVPLILQEKSFCTAQKYYNFYTGFLLVLSLAMMLITLLKQRRSASTLRQKSGTVPGKKSETDPAQRTARVLWTVFILLLIVQLVMAVILAYEEGDDAFYVAISTATTDSDTMYIKLPYTGGTTGLDARHGLAPFPIWIAYLSAMTGIPAVTVNQIVLPLVLILMAYAIYYLIGKALFDIRGYKLPLFLVLAELLVLWGGYSVYSAENFLLVRTAQGKAVLCNIIIPFLFLLILILYQRVQEGMRTGALCWFLAGLSLTAGCLCSTLGSVLTCLLFGVFTLCAVVAYRKWKLLFPLALCCVLPACYTLLYLVLE